eukprot:390911-Hanusia_phi.AAC.1
MRAMRVEGRRVRGDMAAQLAWREMRWEMIPPPSFSLLPPPPSSSSLPPTQDKVFYSYRGKTVFLGEDAMVRDLFSGEVLWSSTSDADILDGLIAATNELVKRREARAVERARDSDAHETRSNRPVASRYRINFLPVVMTRSISTSQSKLLAAETEEEDIQVEHGRRLLQSFAYLTETEMKCVIKEYSSPVPPAVEEEHIRWTSSSVPAEQEVILPGVSKEADRQLEDGEQNVQRRCERDLYEEEISQLMRERLCVEGQAENLLQLLSLAVSDGLKKSPSSRRRPLRSPSKSLKDSQSSGTGRGRGWSGRRSEVRGAAGRCSDPSACAEKRRQQEVYVSTHPHRLRFDEPLVQLV